MTTDQQLVLGTVPRVEPIAMASGHRQIVFQSAGGGLRIEPRLAVVTRLLELSPGAADKVRKLAAKARRAEAQRELPNAGWIAGRRLHFEAVDRGDDRIG